MKKYFLSTLIVLSTLLTLPFIVSADTNSGFIPGQIWYSNNNLIEGDTVNIHTAVWNGEKNSIATKVEFYDKNVILGSRDITLSPLELKDVFISWKVTSGDHVISAKITSSTITISGKKESIVLDRIITSNDKQSVSVVTKNEKGELVKGTTALQTKLEDTGEKINEYLPEEVSTFISKSFTTIENFREKELIRVTKIKEEAKEEIDLIKNEGKTTVEKVTGKTDIENVTKKPITYIKFFLFSTLFFVLGNKIVFYALLIIIAFYILRKIYRAIRNR